jgi:hypothetical protein
MASMAVSLHQRMLRDGLAGPSYAYRETSLFTRKAWLQRKDKMRDLVAARIERGPPWIPQGESSLDWGSGTGTK